MVQYTSGYTGDGSVYTGDGSASILVDTLGMVQYTSRYTGEYYFLDHKTHKTGIHVQCS